MKVVVVGAGLMGAQIGCEYALGGHEVALVARRVDRVRERVEDALRLAEEAGLFSSEETGAARERVQAGSDLDAVSECDLAVESVPEDLGLKADLLRRVASASPDAVLASNASSLSITRLGEAIGEPERTLGTHYLNPPLLMPPVEVVPGERTDASAVALVRDTLLALGKRPVVVERDVPGFIWNRLQFALLRECLWLVEHGVASAEAVDEVVRSGLARRWRQVGPFEAIALGGVDAWKRAGANLLPELSKAERLGELEEWVPTDEAALAGVKERRDRALAEELLRERSDGGRR